MVLNLRPRGDKTSQGGRMKDLLSCSAWTRFGHRVSSVGWLAVKSVSLLPYAKSSQRLGQSLKVLSWGLLPVLSSAVLERMPMCACLPGPPHVAAAALSFCEPGEYFWTAGTIFHFLSIGLVGDRAANSEAECSVNLWGNCVFLWLVLSPGSAQRQHHYLFLPAFLVLKCL